MELKMSRPAKSQELDLSKAHELTVGAIERLQCPPGKSQAFLRDAKAPSLRVRVTALGAKSFVFEAKLHRQTIRRTIGSISAWSIEAARIEANRLRVLVDSKTDPRELDRQQHAVRESEKIVAAAEALTFEKAWAKYLAERKSRWGDRHYADHVAKAKAGGVMAKRGTRGRGVTVAGPLYPLMALRLKDLTPSVVAAWAAQEAKTRPTAARLAWRLLKGFLGWCAEQEEFSGVVPDQNPAKVKAAREVLGRSRAKQDSLQREQLEPWFSAVRGLSNATAAAYLQVLLLTGARPGEVLALRWEDINERWKGLTIRDKVEGERVIPLTPYVAHLIQPLPRVNGWVFASPSSDPDLREKQISIPRNPHEAACRVAGIDGLSLHGLRRSFKSLTEWMEIPAGVVAQIMGHKPSATAEKHYTVRPLDLLRMHHEKIESWILEAAGIKFEVETGTDASKLRRIK